ncbi:unnamed protein product [Heterobilharzia americana]|nr:unnamed protein product [Heterobilharzia americana]
MRQKSLESKVKSMSNHLVTSLANPLSSKVDEWRRNLCLLEKDRARQTKRVRAELKKALAEAQKWEKKAAKIGISGSGGVGPGVGHGIIPSPNLACSNSESNAVNTQAAKAAREVGIKKELVENTEKSAIRLLLLEERSRFCFFVSCLLPILECQSSMLNEIATMDELIQSLTKETEYPNQLVEDVESIVLRMGRRDISVSSRASSKTISVFLPDTGGKMGNMNDILGGLFLTNNNRNCVNSSDTESGRHCTDMLPFHLRRESNSVGRCNSVCDSGDVSLCGASSHSGSGGSNCPSLLSPVRSNIAHLGSRESSLISVDSAASGSGNANPSYSIGMSNANVPHSDSEETQFKTLCRPGHYRAASNGDSDFSKHLKNGFRHHNRGDSMIAKSMIAFNPQSELSENLTTTDDQSCPTKGSEHDVDSVGGDKSENDDVNKLDVNTGLDRDDSNGDDDDDDDNDVGDEDEGEYVAVGNDSSGNASCLPDDSTSQALSNSANQHFPLDNYALSTSSGPPVPNSGRHTISSAYERGCHAPTRAPIMALSFNPPVGKASSKDSGVDSSAVLYPKQAVPPPVYTNLTQLAHAAQRKFSMSQLPIIHSYENVDNTTLERLRYAKNDIKATCHHYPHQQMHHNSMSTNTTQNQAMHSTQNGNYTNWSASGSLNKLHVNDSGLNPSRGGEQYTDPSALLQNQIDKLSSNTSLSSSCFSSKHHLDNVPGPDGGTITTVSNLPGHQTNGTDPFSIEMEELDQVMPVDNNSRMLGKITSQYMDNHLDNSVVMTNYCLSTVSSGAENRASCYLTDKLTSCNRDVSKAINTVDSCFTLSEIDDADNGDSSETANYRRQDFFTPQSFCAQKLLSDDDHMDSSKYPLCTPTCHAVFESDIKATLNTNLIRQPPPNNGSILRQNACHTVNSSLFVVNNPPPPIQPKPTRLRHIQAISQYSLNRKPGGLSRPCPPPRTCSVLSSQDCLLTSGVSMPCGLNASDMSSYNKGIGQYSNGDHFYEGSSRGSSLTMASSTTNDSLPSSNGSPALVSYHANARRSVSSNPPYSQNSLVSEQSLENKLHYATPVVKNSSQCSASQMSNLMRHSTLVSNQVCINNQANSYTGYETKDISNGNLSSTSPPPPPPPPPPLPIFSNQLSKPTVPSSHSSLELNPSNSPCYTVKSAASSDLVSVETANLMSELSSQLQQLAARTNDIRFSPSKTNPISTDVSDEHNKECVRYDEFDLPPPPPSSMFTEQCYTSSQHKQGYSVNQLATDTTTASTTDSTGGQEESDTNLSPFLLALKQSVKQRADRLANQNSMIN